MQIRIPLTRRNTFSATLLLALTLAPSLGAQWLGYATPNVPKKPDGNPNLAAPAPRTADGKPDLSGMWGWVNIGKPCGAQCTDTQISREFINIASTLKSSFALPAVGGCTGKETQCRAGTRIRTFIACRADAPRIWTDDYYKRIFEVPGRVIILTERNMQYRQIFTDGRALPEGSESDLERLLDRPLGRRHAGSGDHRFPRRSLAGCRPGIR